MVSRETVVVAPHIVCPVCQHCLHDHTTIPGETPIVACRLCPQHPFNITPCVTPEDDQFQPILAGMFRLMLHDYHEEGI